MVLRFWVSDLQGSIFLGEFLHGQSFICSVKSTFELLHSEIFFVVQVLDASIHLHVLGPKTGDLTLLLELFSALADHLVEGLLHGVQQFFHGVFLLPVEQVFFFLHGHFSFDLHVLHHLVSQLVVFESDEESVFESGHRGLLVHVDQLQLDFFVFLDGFRALGHEAVHVVLQLVEHLEVFGLLALHLLDGLHGFVMHRRNLVVPKQEVALEFFVHPSVQIFVLVK